MRITFHAYIDNSEWDISTTNDTPDYSKPALAMKGKSVAKAHCVQDNEVISASERKENVMQEKYQYVYGVYQSEEV